MLTRQCIVFALLLSLLSLEFSVLAGAEKGTYVLITDFFSCDRFGAPQNYFPMKTTVYFNISLRNLTFDPKNITVNVSVLDCTNVTISLDRLNTTIPHNATEHYIMSIFIPKWARVGFATAYATVFVEGKLVDGERTGFYIGPEDLTPPTINLLSPENVTYGVDSVPVVFTVNEIPYWMGYSVNNQENVTVQGNSTLTGLVNGQYNIIVYANDTSGNMGFSQVYFTILVIHDIAVTDLQCSPLQIYIGQLVNILVSVQNEGTVPETFNVSIHVNTTNVETLTVTNLSAGDNSILPFTWNTTGMTKGNYTIESTANPILGETDIADNTYVDGVVNIMARPDIHVTSALPSKTIVGQGYSVQIDTTISNQGDQAETFNVTVYTNSTPIRTKTITLASGNSTIITFFWNTTGFIKGNYTIVTVAWPVPNETDTTDNTLVDGWIFVTIRGDVNGDRDVDIFDIVRITGVYRAKKTDPQYNPNYDLDGDGDIDIFDIVIVAGNYGDSW